MEYDTIYTLLKWVIIVLIAGFIGQFGKSLSLYLIGLFKRNKERNKSAENTSASSASIKEKDQQAKVQKKALKAQVKAQKKNSN